MNFPVMRYINFGNNDKARDEITREIILSEVNRRKYTSSARFNLGQAQLNRQTIYFLHQRLWLACSFGQSENCCDHSLGEFVHNNDLITGLRNTNQPEPWSYLIRASQFADIILLTFCVPALITLRADEFLVYRILVLDYYIKVKIRVIFYTK